MDIVLCHVTADFDTLGAAVGVSRLTGARIVLTGGAHPTVSEFLALHRDEYALIEGRSVLPEQIRSLTIVDTQKRDRLGKYAGWLDLPHLEVITLYDHHLDVSTDIPATRTHIEPVGAATTLIVEQLQTSKINLTPAEATVMALGIHVDTGSLTFEQSSVRDALAIAWLMGQGANQKAIAQYVEPGLSPQLQDLLKVALETIQTETVQGFNLSWVLLQTPDYVPGLSSLASRLLEITESQALLLGASWGNGRLTVIGRSQIEDVNLNQLFQPFGGGGHPQAASLTQRDVDSQATLQELLAQLKAQLPQPLTARELMSSPVRTIRPETTIQEAQRILLRYGHSGLSIVNNTDELIGIISRRDIDLALHHGDFHAPVKGYMSANLKTITPDTLLADIESLMVTYDIGRLPVLENGHLVGIVTRTDVLRTRGMSNGKRASVLDKNQTQFTISDFRLQLKSFLTPPLQKLLSQIATEAEKRGWHLYLVGGAVRDVLLNISQKKLDNDLTNHSFQKPISNAKLQDIDLVVDGFHQAADTEAGVSLAQAIGQLYPNTRLEIHGAFQTAALLWHDDPDLGSLALDIATARTEFYPYPAANPEVEASSIRQDLYRRDFTINALAVRLTSPRSGELLDYFGGLEDLEKKQIRVLHGVSFIEDPTRIYRAVRFAVRLGFEIEAQSRRYIHYALESGIYERSLLQNPKVPALQTRLKAELKYMLQSPYWMPALKLLASLGALRCIHPNLEFNKNLEWQVRLISRWLQRFDPTHTLIHWQMRLEVLLISLSLKDRLQVSTNLQLPQDSLERLQAIERSQKTIVEGLKECKRPSQIEQLLRSYKLPTLVLIGVIERSVRKQIWYYLNTLKNIQPPLNGNELKQLGYKPGREFKGMLDALLSATLDGIVQDKESAKVFLKEHYPNS